MPKERSHVIPSLVTFKENSLLVQILDLIEIRSVFREMDGSSAPSFDGFTSDIFNYCWMWLVGICAWLFKVFSYWFFRAWI